LLKQNGLMKYFYNLYLSIKINSLINLLNNTNIGIQRRGEILTSSMENVFFFVSPIDEVENKTMCEHHFNNSLFASSLLLIVLS
jgi:hypothetical protein